MARTRRLSPSPRAIGAVFLSTALAVTAPVAVADPAAASRGQFSIEWAPCEADPTADCGTLAVPVDWSRPSGPTVDIAVARRRATDPAARIGSLLINPGGPGGSGVDFALYGADYFTPEITRRFDLIGFDPRGVARSHPVVCSAELLEATPSPVLTSQADFDRLVAHNRRVAADCRQRTGPLFDHVDTLSVVRDLDALRGAVGDRKLSYYGVSYGTLIGQQYAERYGDRVRALVLDSNMDHSLGTEGFLMTETVTGEESFDEFAAWCDRTVDCAVHDRGVRTVWAGLRERAARGELVLPGEPDFKIDPFVLSFIALSAFYGPSWWSLAELMVALETGVWPDEATAAAARTGAGGRAGIDRRTAPLTTADLAAELRTRVAATAEEETYEDATAVFCEDWSLPVRDYREYARYVDRMWKLAPDFGPSPLALAVPMSCVGWPTKVNNPQHRLRVRDTAPLLMTNARYDPATAYSWAVNAADQLGRHAVLVTYEGWGHGVYGRESCGTGAMDAYLTTRALPARGTRCAAVEPPKPPPADAATLGGRSAGLGQDPGPRAPGWARVAGHLVS